MATLNTSKHCSFKTPILIALLYLSVFVTHAGEKHLVIFGGGGEPKGPSTIFDSHVNILSRFSASKGSRWSTSISFNGGHEQTEKFLEVKMSKATSFGHFNEENFNKILKNLEEKIELGELKAGDQLMLVMDTHGAVARDGEKTHSVALSAGAAQDLKTLSGSKNVSMDKLEKLVTLASEKGVKLALIDLSCFSGNTLKIANPNTCIVSATGEDQYGYTEEREAEDISTFSTFGGRLLQEFKIGGNLEDAFLKARVATTSPDFPMISTGTGKMVNDFIYKMITPFLLYNESSSTDFSKSYDVKNFALSFCKTQEQYDEIKKRLDEIANLASIPKKILDTTKLKKALEDYRKYQIYYEKALVATQNAAQEVKDIINRDYPDKAKLFSREDGLSIIQVDRSRSLETYKRWVDDAKDDWSKNFYQKLYNEQLDRDRISKDVKTKLSAESKDNIKKFDEIFKHSYKTRELAVNVSTESKKLYHKLYMAQKTKDSNPCRDFVL